MPPASGACVHYNHPGGHLDPGKIPGEAAGINVEGGDKWRTMIQNGAYMLARTGEGVWGHESGCRAPARF